MQIEWEWSHFDQLSPAARDAVLDARRAVFGGELHQHVNGFEATDYDAHHLIGWVDHDGKRELAAYVRCVKPGVKFDETSLGSVLTTQLARGKGLGRELMAQAVARAQQLHGGGIRIGALSHLEKFYASCGFVTVTEPYIGHGLEHVGMLHPARQ